MTLDDEIALALSQANQEIAERGFATEDDLQTWDALKDVYASIEWIWPNWLPRGYVTLLASVPGVGKSMLALTAAKLVTHGGQWPDGYETINKYSKVLWIETENGEPFHIGRARSIGMPLSHVLTPLTRADDDVQISLTNETHRKRIAYAAALESVDVIVVDSLSGGNTLDENSTQVGAIVQWLASVAKKVQKPIILIHHMNKSGYEINSSRPPSAGKIRGSGSILQYARVIWTLDTPDVERKDQLRLACVKNNLGPFAKPLQIEFDGVGRLIWNAAVVVPQSVVFEDAIRELARQNPRMTVEQIAQQEHLSEAQVSRILRTGPRSQQDAF